MKVENWEDIFGGRYGRSRVVAEIKGVATTALRGKSGLDSGPALEELLESHTSCRGRSNRVLTWLPVRHGLASCSLGQAWVSAHHALWPAGGAHSQRRLAVTPALADALSLGALALAVPYRHANITFSLSTCSQFCFVFDSPIPTSSQPAFFEIPPSVGVRSGRHEDRPPGIPAGHARAPDVGTQGYPLWELCFCGGKKKQLYYCGCIFSKSNISSSSCFPC